MCFSPDSSFAPVNGILLGSGNHTGLSALTGSVGRSTTVPIRALPAGRHDRPNSHHDTSCSMTSPTTIAFQGQPASLPVCTRTALAMWQDTPHFSARPTCQPSLSSQPAVLVCGVPSGNKMPDRLLLFHRTPHHCLALARGIQIQQPGSPGAAFNICLFQRLFTNGPRVISQQA